MQKIYVSKKFGFEAAHHLVNYDGKCSHLHGHSYKLEVIVSGLLNTCYDQTYAKDCMVIDFSDLKHIVNAAVIDFHDHADLNDIYTNPTAEVMVVSMFLEIKAQLPSDVTLEAVKLWETEDSYAEYRGE